MGDPVPEFFRVLVLVNFRELVLEILGDLVVVPETFRVLVLVNFRELVPEFFGGPSP